MFGLEPFSQFMQDNSPTPFCSRPFSQDPNSIFASRVGDWRGDPTVSFDIIFWFIVGDAGDAIERRDVSFSIPASLKEESVLALSFQGQCYSNRGM
jgi:hypothetical protein